jgi:hypothetical protein
MLSLVIVTTAMMDATAVKAMIVADTPWHVHAGKANAALEADDLGTATYHWREAYVAAVASRRWQGMVEVGDLHRRIGARGGFSGAAAARARECYLTALLRARAEGSIDGVLQATDAFLEIGDDAVVSQGLQIARAVATRDPDPRARERVAMLEARAARSATARREAGAPSWVER